MHSKQMAASASLLLGVALTCAKIGAGLFTGSLSILAEAIDSVLDLVAGVVTYLAVRVADQPPDDNHPYGHARADSLGALAQVGLLLLTALWIGWQAIERIVWQPVLPTISAWVLVLVVASLLVNVLRVWLLRRAAAASGSQALQASAANFSNDMFGSLVVLLALGIISFHPWLPLPLWLVLRADAFAALVVASVALWLAWQQGQQAIRALMDDVPPDLNRRLTYRVLELPHVLPGSAQVRTRFVGQQAYVDVTVSTSRDRSLEEAHELSEQIQQAIRTELHQASVLVHVEPARAPAEPFSTAIYSVAHRLGLRVHNLDLYQLAHGVRVEMDLELPDSLTLAEAHTHSEALEAAVQAELPHCADVTVHLEPRRDQMQPAVHYTPLTHKIKQVVARLPDATLISHIETLLTDSGPIVTLRCQFPGHISLTEVHEAMVRIEHDLRQALPDLGRVQIDPEPATMLETHPQHRLLLTP